jgi:hypothetical protein
MQNSISFVTIGANMVLKEVIIMLTCWVGYATYSEELTSITKGVFLAQFFNTGFQLLIVNANLKEYSTGLGSVFDGPFPDYNPAWFDNVGDLTMQSMIINSVMPWNNLVVTWMTPKAM